MAALWKLMMTLRFFLSLPAVELLQGNFLICCQFA
jgi:hypothetical protein